jgi:hypothetical protein
MINVPSGARILLATRPVDFIVRRPAISVSGIRDKRLCLRNIRSPLLLFARAADGGVQLTISPDHLIKRPFPGNLLVCNFEFSGAMGGVAADDRSVVTVWVHSRGMGERLRSPRRAPRAQFPSVARARRGQYRPDSLPIARSRCGV